MESDVLNSMQEPCEHVTQLLLVLVQMHLPYLLMTEAKGALVKSMFYVFGSFTASARG